MYKILKQTSCLILHLAPDSQQKWTLVMVSHESKQALSLGAHSVPIVTSSYLGTLQNGDLRSEILHMVGMLSHGK